MNQTCAHSNQDIHIYLLKLSQSYRFTPKLPFHLSQGRGEGSRAGTGRLCRKQSTHSPKDGMAEVFSEGKIVAIIFTLPLPASPAHTECDVTL